MATAVQSSNLGAVQRAQVAACTRLLNMLGILHYSGHVSERVPGKDRLYIQTRTESRAEVTPESVLLVDFDGNVLEGAPGRPPSELVIHTGIYRKRPNVGAVIHNHMPLAVALTMVKDVKPEIMDFHAAHWKDAIPVMREVGHIKTISDGQALANALGDANALLLRAHGVVLTAESTPGILIDTVHFEENLKAMKEARSFGGDLAPVTDRDIARIMTTVDREHIVRKSWNYYVAQGRRAGALPREWAVDL